MREPIRIAERDIRRYQRRQSTGRSLAEIVGAFVRELVAWYWR